MLLFYVEAMTGEIEQYDNDGDSLIQMEMVTLTVKNVLEGTDPNSAESFPVGIEPDPPEKWIIEDDLDWGLISTGENYVGR